MRYNTIFWYALLPSLTLAIILVSCEGKFEPDPIDPRIPRYSEDNLNAAGALVNGESWRAVLNGGSFFSRASQDMEVARDSTWVRLTIEGRVLNNYHNDLWIEFRLNNADGNFDNMARLAGRKFDLGGEHRAAVLDGCCWLDESPSCLSSSGQLYIRHLKAVVQENDKDYVISGTFSFTVDRDSCTYYEVTDGRFDYRVDGY